MLRFLLGTLALLATVCVAIFIEGGDLLKLLLPSPLLLTLLVPFFAVLAVWDFKAWGRAWADAIKGPIDQRRREASARLWSFYETASYAAGFIAFVAGAMIILVGPVGEMPRYWSVGLVAPLLAAIWGLLARILRYRVLLER